MRITRIEFLCIGQRVNELRILYDIRARCLAIAQRKITPANCIIEQGRFDGVWIIAEERQSLLGQLDTFGIVDIIRNKASDSEGKQLERRLRVATSNTQIVQTTSHFHNSVRKIVF